KRENHAGKTHLFADHRENEIRMPGRQKSQSILGTAEKSFADQTARTNRDFRLRDLITLSQRISLRIDERQNTFLLVWLKNEPGNRKDKNKTQNQGNQERRLDTAYKQSNSNRRQKRERSSEIGLQGDQTHW